MSAFLAGRGVIECGPYLQRSYSSDTSLHDNIHHDRPSPKRTKLNPFATGKGGDETEMSNENICRQPGSEVLTRHANPTQLSKQGVHRAIGKRLGEKELGPYHAELRMPSALFERLVTQEIRQTQHINASTGQLYRVGTPCNELRHIIPSLAYLLHCVSAGSEDMSRSIKSATLCHPCVRHVFKLPNEGGFCGYRNAQILCSFIAGTDWSASRAKVLTREERWRTKDMDVLPNVIELQHMIEAAWDAGINSHCREETGGLIGRRVYIGTPEIQSLLISLDIPSATYSIPGEPDLWAYEALIETVVRHFHPYETETADLVEECLASGGTLNKTLAPPLFLQQPGHSLTIVGYEVNGDDSISLIILDPGYAASPAIRKIAERFSSNQLYSETHDAVDNSWNAFPFEGGRSVFRAKEKGVWPDRGSRAEILPADAGKLLKAYRRDREKLSQYEEFEIVALERRQAHDE